jgi:hypothetical protein
MGTQLYAKATKPILSLSVWRGSLWLLRRRRGYIRARYHRRRVISLVLLTALHFLQTRAKGVGGGGRAIAKLMLVMGMLLEVVAGGTSNGASAGLAPDQLAAWGVVPTFSGSGPGNSEYCSQ